jgi:hypothetical protein
VNLISAFQVSWREFLMTVLNRSAGDTPPTADPDKTPLQQPRVTTIPNDVVTNSPSRNFRWMS